MTSTEPTLPSITAAKAFLRREPGALLKVGYSMLERSIFISSALFVAGVRKPKPLLLQTFMVTLFIEGAVLWQIRSQLKGQASARSDSQP